MQVFIQRLTFNMCFFILQMPGFYFLFAPSFQSTKGPECNAQEQFRLLFYVCPRALFNDKELIALIAAKY